MLLSNQMDFVYCVNYDCQGTKLTINILWVVTVKSTFPNPNVLFHPESVLYQENALRCGRVLAAAGKAESLYNGGRGAEPPADRKYREGLELACQSA